MTRPRGSSGGFTLVEALVAMTLSAVLITLVTSVFLAQNRLYQDVVTRSRVQESARSVAEMVASELRPATRGSVGLAESRRLTVRSPQVVGTICDKSGSSVHVFLPLEGEGVDTTEVSGYGILESDGSWSFYPDAWGDFYAASGSSTSVGGCVAAGMDTVDVSAGDFFRFDGPGTDPTPSPGPRDLLMIYREIQYEIQASGLDDGALGLFRGLTGGTAVEFATGLTADARFEYLLDGETGYRSSVTGADLEDIVRVRLVSTATQTVATPGGGEPYRYGFTVDIPFRNAR